MKSIERPPLDSRFKRLRRFLAVVFTSPSSTHRLDRPGADRGFSRSWNRPHCNGFRVLLFCFGNQIGFSHCPRHPLSRLAPGVVLRRLLLSPSPPRLDQLIVYSTSARHLACPALCNWLSTIPEALRICTALCLAQIQIHPLSSVQAAM